MSGPDHALCPFVWVLHRRRESEKSTRKIFSILHYYYCYFVRVENQVKKILAREYDEWNSYIYKHYSQQISRKFLDHFMYFDNQQVKKKTQKAATGPERAAWLVTAFVYFVYRISYFTVCTVLFCSTVPR